MHVNFKVVGAVALGVGAMAVLTACASANEGKTPEQVAGDALDKFNFPFTNGSQLDTRGETTHPVYALDGQLQGTWDAARMLRAADDHAYGESKDFDPSLDVKGNHKASYNELVQVARHFDGDSSGVLDGVEAKQYDREAGPTWVANPFYDPLKGL
jgi:hypothetical protein